MPTGGYPCEQPQPLGLTASGPPPPDTVHPLPVSHCHLSAGAARRAAACAVKRVDIECIADLSMCEVKTLCESSCNQASSRISVGPGGASLVWLAHHTVSWDLPGS